MSLPSGEERDVLFWSTKEVGMATKPCKASLGMVASI